MAVVSTHILNGVDGSHAGRIPVKLVDLSTGLVMFSSATDDAGRLALDVEISEPSAQYEMTFSTGAYWDERQYGGHGERLMNEIIVRFRMPKPDGRYHIPVILAPHSTSYWCSTEHG